MCLKREKMPIVNSTGYGGKSSLILHIIAWGAMSLAVHSAYAVDYTYGYDELGRLTTMVDASGNTARYGYDEVGNLQTIQRTQPPLVVTDFSPALGGTGATVTIYGAGFDGTTPANNIVSFSGSAGTLVQAITQTPATANTLMVTVPAGVVVGPITVLNTATGASDDSDQQFQPVLSTGLPSSFAPSITSISPASGVADDPETPTQNEGTLITITGKNFPDTPDTIRVAFNTKVAKVLSITKTQITVQVPASASTGRIEVLTQGGRAFSQDFLIAPSSFALANLMAPVRVGTSQSTPSTNIPVGKTAVVVFGATDNGFFTLDLAALNADIFYKVYAPDGSETPVLSGSATPTSNRSLHIPIPAQAGTYAIYLTGVITAAPPTFVATLKSDTVLSVNGSGSQSSANIAAAPGFTKKVAKGSDATTPQLTFPGQSIRYGLSLTPNVRPIPNNAINSRYWNNWSYYISAGFQLNVELTRPQSQYSLVNSCAPGRCEFWVNACASEVNCNLDYSQQVGGQYSLNISPADPNITGAVAVSAGVLFFDTDYDQYIGGTIGGPYNPFE